MSKLPANAPSVIGHPAWTQVQSRCRKKASSVPANAPAGPSDRHPRGGYGGSNGGGSTADLTGLVQQLQQLQLVQQLLAQPTASAPTGSSASGAGQQWTTAHWKSYRGWQKQQRRAGGSPGVQPPAPGQVAGRWRKPRGRPAGAGSSAAGAGAASAKPPATGTAESTAPPVRPRDPANDVLLEETRDQLKRANDCYGAMEASGSAAEAALAEQRSRINFLKAKLVQHKPLEDRLAKAKKVVGQLRQERDKAVAGAAALWTKAQDALDAAELGDRKVVKAQAAMRDAEAEVVELSQQVGVQPPPTPVEACAQLLLDSYQTVSSRLATESAAAAVFEDMSAQLVKSLQTLAKPQELPKLPKKMEVDTEPSRESGAPAAHPAVPPSAAGAACSNADEAQGGRALGSNDAKATVHMPSEGGPSPDALPPPAQAGRPVAPMPQQPALPVPGGPTGAAMAQPQQQAPNAASDATRQLADALRHPVLGDPEAVCQARKQLVLRMESEEAATEEGLQAGVLAVQLAVQANQVVAVVANPAGPDPEGVCTTEQLEALRPHKKHKQPGDDDMHSPDHLTEAPDGDL